MNPIADFFVQSKFLIDMLTVIALALAVLFFFWGLARFIMADDGPKERAAGRQYMLWGVIAIFVLVSIWGIVGWMEGVFGVGAGGSMAVPGVVNTANNYEINP